MGAKLIVMGAYEHSKFSQDLFGGVTHEVIRSSQVPVFMSH
ncbi:universal stress protein [Phaeobacter gallaeciensis]|nr:universal stress protein [Phaeobacter gallaeciensis]